MAQQTKKGLKINGLPPYAWEMVVLVLVDMLRKVQSINIRLPKVRVSFTTRFCASSTEKQTKNLVIKSDYIAMFNGNNLQVFFVFQV